MPIVNLNVKLKPLCLASLNPITIRTENFGEEIGTFFLTHDFDTLVTCLRMEYPNTEWFRTSSYYRDRQLVPEGEFRPKDSLVVVYLRNKNTGQIKKFYFDFSGKLEEKVREEILIHYKFLRG